MLTNQDYIMLLRQTECISKRLNELITLQEKSNDLQRENINLQRQILNLLKKQLNSQ
ncbi:MAG: hypothetical protein J5507_00390 [Clostridia bacterium]|nr:hypothetical protein [Clostridia bacterium]